MIDLFLSLQAKKIKMIMKNEFKLRNTADKDKYVTEYPNFTYIMG